MAMRRQRRDAVTEEEIAAFNEASHQFGNDSARIALYMVGRDEISAHARQIYRGDRRAVTNRLNVVRRTIRRRQLEEGHLPPNEDRRDDRFAYEYDRLQNHQDLMVSAFVRGKFFCWFVFNCLDKCYNCNKQKNIRQCKTWRSLFELLPEKMARLYFPRRCWPTASSTSMWKSTHDLSYYYMSILFLYSKINSIYVCI